MLEKRDALPPSEAERLSQLVQENVIKSAMFQSANVVGAYSAIGSEVRTDMVMTAAKSQGKTLALPRIEGDKMLFYEMTSPDDLVKGKYGIKEPLPKRLVKTVDIVLVPGVAFDNSGFRIDYNKNYYDRFLSQRPALFSVGVCYSFQVLPGLPQSRFDRRLDSLVTDNGFVYF
jgi:5-formyltetrahydrofolate cyclo-ligase